MNHIKEETNEDSLYLIDNEIRARVDNHEYVYTIDLVENKVFEIYRRN